MKYQHVHSYQLTFILNCASFFLSVQNQGMNCCMSASLENYAHIQSNYVKKANLLCHSLSVSLPFCFN